MWIRLAHEADAAVVAAQLQGMGLWRPAQDAQGATTGFAIERRDDRLATLGDDRGVIEVQARSAHPSVDALAGQPVSVGALSVGRGASLLLSGPPLESQAQVDEIAAAVAAAGASILRVVRTSRGHRHSFSGHGEQALTWLKQAADHYDMVVTEVMSEADVGLVGSIADLLQVGSRNMQNFALFAVGAERKPVLLKRGMAATVEEWLLAGHLLAAGAVASSTVRGISGFDPHTRNTRLKRSRCCRAFIVACRV